MLRRLLVAFLMLALPVQGALASSRWLCVAMSQGAQHVAAAPAQDHHHGHAAAAPGAHVHDGDASGAAHDHGRTHGGESGCNLCAACTVTAATPPSALALPAIDASPAPIRSLDVRMPSVVTDGLERPPRTV